LWAEIDRLAIAIGTAVPTELWLVPDARVALWEDARMLGLRNGPQRLTIGLPLLSGLTVVQFQTLAAHELGRYGGGLSGKVYRGADTLGSVATGTGEASGSGTAISGWTTAGGRSRCSTASSGSSPSRPASSS
jgi:hypothetical protein